MRYDYLDAEQITKNIQTWNPRGFSTVSGKHRRYATSERGILVHKVRGVRLDWGNPSWVRAALAVFECNDATFYPQFFDRVPSPRQRPFLRRCKRCFG